MCQSKVLCSGTTSCRRQKHRFLQYVLVVCTLLLYFFASTPVMLVRKYLSYTYSTVPQFLSVIRFQRIQGLWGSGRWDEYIYAQYTLEKPHYQYISSLKGSDSAHVVLDGTQRPVCLLIVKQAGTRAMCQECKIPQGETRKWKRLAMTKIALPEERQSLIPTCLWSYLPLQKWWKKKRRKRVDLQRKKHQRSQNGIAKMVKKPK